MIVAALRQASKAATWRAVAQFPDPAFIVYLDAKDIRCARFRCDRTLRVIMNKLIVAVQMVAWDSMRIFRSAWVSFTNGTAIYLLYAGTRQDALLNNLLEQDNRNKGLWLHFALWATIPLLGVVLEFLGSRFAKLLNLGYFTYFGVVFTGIGISSWPDHHGLIILLFGVLALGVTGVNYLVYRRPSSTPAVSSSP